MPSASGKTPFPTRKSSGWIKMAFSPFQTSSLPSRSLGCGRKWRRFSPSKAPPNRGCRRSAQTCKINPLLLIRRTASQACFTHPRLLAAVAHVLREDFRSLGIHSRPNRPGGGHQPLHVDYGGPPAKPGTYYVCNSMWMLTDFTKENGPTRAVPGSHRSDKHPQDVMEAPQEAHPDEIKLIGTAGTVVVFNSHLWHGATLNRSQNDRPNVTSFWCRRHDPHVDRSASDWGVLNTKTFSRLSEAARCLFDYDC